MTKKHIFSAHTDFKTGILYKVFLLITCVLFVMYFLEMLLHPLGITPEALGTLLAFSILTLGFGVMLYFFSRQFAKLSEIANDVEQDESLDESEDAGTQP